MIEFVIKILKFLKKPYYYIHIDFGQVMLRDYLLNERLKKHPFRIVVYYSKIFMLQKTTIGSETCPDCLSRFFEEVIELDSDFKKFGSIEEALIAYKEYAKKNYVDIMSIAMNFQNFENLENLETYVKNLKDEDS